MVGDADPGAGLVARATHDLRPAGLADLADLDGLTGLTGRPPGGVVVAGPDDLCELRAVVERVTGSGSWPAPAATFAAAAVPVGARVTERVAVASPATLLGLVAALEGHIERRSPWSTWRGVVDALAGPVGELATVTVDAVLVASDPG